MSYLAHPTSTQDYGVVKIGDLIKITKGAISWENYAAITIEATDITEIDITNTGVTMTTAVFIVTVTTPTIITTIVPGTKGEHYVRLPLSRLQVL